MDFQFCRLFFCGVGLDQGSQAVFLSCRLDFFLCCFVMSLISAFGCWPSRLSSNVFEPMGSNGEYQSFRLRAFVACTSSRSIPSRDVQVVGENELETQADQLMRGKLFHRCMEDPWKSMRIKKTTKFIQGKRCIFVERIPRAGHHADTWGSNLPSEGRGIPPNSHNEKRNDEKPTLKLEEFRKTVAAKATPKDRGQFFALVFLQVAESAYRFWSKSSSPRNNKRSLNASRGKNRCLEAQSNDLRNGSFWAKDCGSAREGGSLGRRAALFRAVLNVAVAVCC